MNIELYLPMVEHVYFKTVDNTWLCVSYSPPSVDTVGEGETKLDAYNDMMTIVTSKHDTCH